MKTARPFGQVVLAAVALGFLALVLAVASVAWGLSRQQETNRWVSHTYDVELTLADIRLLTERAETARRGFLLLPDDRFLRTFTEAEAQLAPALDRIGALTRDNPAQTARVERLRQGVENQKRTILQSFDIRRTKGMEEAQAAFLSGGAIDVIRDLRAITLEMVADEQTLLGERRRMQSASTRLSYGLTGLAALVLLVVAGGTIWAVRRNLAALKSSRDELRDLNDNLERAVETRTADLRRANDEIQRFAYIVSHDLRSPLVNVMGFTSELDAAAKPLAEMLERAEAEAPQIVSPDARTAVREDLPEAIGFIRSSTEKMDRLINAILRLSREGRRIIAPERLTIAQMLDGIAGSLAHRAGEIGAEIAIARDMPDVVSDRVAVEQIFSNLVENAMKYRNPQRPLRIAVRGRSSAGQVRYEVEDNGRGVDPKDHERIFDLFRRSGMQDQPGEGIGLAHARALAYRLGGSISCSSELGKGSIFSLTLPSVYKPAREG